jgi:hypothetical protein
MVHVYLGGTSCHLERIMAHPAPFNAEPIGLTDTQSPGEARNLLVREGLELNLMPFAQEPSLFCKIITPANLATTDSIG